MAMRIVLTILFLGFFISNNAQVSFGTSDHNVEISGAISTYYNHRFYKDGFTDFKKNRYKLRDAQIQVEGRYKNKVAYEFQIDFADLALANSGSIDPENPGLMDAYVIFKHIPFVDVRVGYGKTPYSRASQVPFIYSPYWQRAEIVRGNIFSRRDIGVTLSSSLWKQRIKIYGGMYNGLGEISLKGDNDASGKPEFVGRAELAFPSRYRYRDIDTRKTPIPMFVVGGNARYMDKSQQANQFLPFGSVGEYLIKIIDGKKYGYGGDFSFQYMGFSAQFEIHQFIMQPRLNTSALFQGTDSTFNEGYVRSGGYYGQINYFSKSIKSIFSIRYESLNINDLADGELQRFSAAVAYQIKGFDAMIKAQYFLNLKEEEFIDALNWNEQFRIGFQYLFK